MFLPKRFCGYQEVGKNVSSELSDLIQLIKGGDFGQVTEIKIAYNPVDEKPAAEEIVGLESEFNQVLESLWGCPRIKDLSTWVIHAPRLQTLVVCSCSSFEEIIADRFSSIDIWSFFQILDC